MYKNEFDNAFARTERLGLKAPARIECQNNKLLNGDFSKLKFMKIMHSQLGDNYAKKLNANCLPIHSQLKKAVEKELKSEVYYTIGSLHVANETAFEITERAIEEMLYSSYTPSTMRIHAWLTLPTMEIIDFTLITTVALANNKPSHAGLVQLGNPDEMKPILYTPMLVGTDFLETMNIAHK